MSVAKILKNSMSSLNTYIRQEPNMVEAIPSNFVSVEGIFGFIKGIFNGTQLTSTPSLKLCETSVTNIANGMTKVYTQISTNQTSYSICLGVDNFISAAYNLDDATTKCYAGAFESIALAKNYGKFTSDPTFLMNNLLYNFGYLYAQVKDVIVYFMGNGQTKAKDPFGAGLAIGQFFYYLLQADSVYWVN